MAWSRTWRIGLRSLSAVPAVAGAATLAGSERWRRAVPSRTARCCSKPAAADVGATALPSTLGPALVESLQRAIATQGSMFEIEFYASKGEFDDAQQWSWAKVGAKLDHSVRDYKPRPTSTADSSNRLRDKKRIESKWAVCEFGNPSIEFFDAAGELVARGYEGIVYGDHGPYLEFKEEQIYWPTFCRHKLKGPGRTHFEHYNADVSLKLYGQFQTVADQPNPPSGFPNPFSTSNNRPEGYADYRPGRIYLSCDAFFEAGGHCA